MRRFFLITLTILLAAGASWAVQTIKLTETPTTDQNQGSAKTGEFETTFTERSPLSEKKDLLKRLNEKDSGDADYDLSQQPFVVYVPQNYDPNTPVGIIFWIGYKDTDSTPPKWKPILDQSHLIFISAKSCSQPDWQRAGLALDAVHNLEAQYKIDPQRVYVFGSPQAPGTILIRTFLSSPDVFTGALVMNCSHYFKTVPLPGTEGYPPDFPPPPSTGQAKNRRLILATDPRQMGVPDWPKEFAVYYRFYQQEGFKHLTRIDLADIEDDHFPNLTEPWLIKALAFLDAPPDTPPPGAATSKPSQSQQGAAVSEPQRMLKLAQLYIDAERYEQARAKLQDLIAKYPSDPAAAQAKQLIDQIKDK